MTQASDIAPTGPRQSWWRRVQPFVFVLGMAGLVVAVVGLHGELEGQELPSARTLFIAVGLSFLALIASARAWVELLGRSVTARSAIDALYISQLTKYLPAGGLLQATSQVSLSSEPGRSGRRVLLTYVLSVISVLVAGSVIASAVVTVDEAPTWIRVVAAGGILAPLLLSRPVLAALLRLPRRFIARFPAISDLPPGAATGRALAWNLVNLGCMSIAFAALLRAFHPDTPIVAATAAFALAWVIGFVVIPVPSGLGIREAILLAVLPGVPTAAMLAASLFHRVVGLFAEGVLAGMAYGRRYRAARARRPAQ